MLLFREVDQIISGRQNILAGRYILNLRFLILVKTDCIDRNSRCAEWADRGECQKNPNYMLVWCRKSCRQCS